jgi:S-layer protein
MTGGGLVLGTALGNNVSFTGGAGDDSIKIGATTKAINMGNGKNTVTTSTGTVGTGGSVTAGTGTADKIIFTTTAHAVTAGTNSVFNSKFSGFEVVELTNALSGTMNVGGINNASTVILKAGGDSTTTAIIQDLASGGTVETQAAGTGFVVNVLGAVGGVNDVLNLKLTQKTATVFTSMTAANVETININVADASSGSAADPASAAVVHSATLAATAAKTITVSGNNGLTLTNTGNVAVTLFDASGVVANNTSASVLANGTSVAATTDSAANLAVRFSSATTEAATTTGQIVTIKGGAGNDTLTGNTLKDNISGGAGADTIYADNAGNKAITATANVTLAAATSGVVTVKIGFAGIETPLFTVVKADATNTTEAEIATGIASAIAADPVMSKLITATVDGVGVIFTSLVDGVLAAPTVTFTKTGVTAPAYTVGTLTAGTAGTAAADVIDGGAGADVIVGGGGADLITTGSGADTVFFLKPQSNLATMATITDFTFAVGGSSNDTIILGDVATAAGTIKTVQDLSASASLSAAINTAALNNAVNNGLSMFIFGGDTYAYVETTGATATYDATDFVVKLVGLPLAAGAAFEGAGFDAV